MSLLRTAWRKGDLVFWWPPEARRAGIETYIPCIATRCRFGLVREAVKADGTLVSEGDAALYAYVVAKERLAVAPRRLLPNLAPSYATTADCRAAFVFKSAVSEPGQTESTTIDKPCGMR